MNSLVGILLVIIAAGTIIGVLAMVTREHHEPEEYYIPPPPDAAPRSTIPDAMMTAEVTGTEQLNASPVIDAQQKRRAEEERD